MRWFSTITKNIEIQGSFDPEKYVWTGSSRFSWLCFNKVERKFMVGAIIGDIVGSRFEFHNHRNKEFELFGKGCFATDDSIMTLGGVLQYG